MRKFVEPHIQRMEALATGGFAIGFHVRNARPLFMERRISTEWVSRYSACNFFAGDPLVIWCVKNLGWERWTAISNQLADPLGVFQAYRSQGMNHGIAVSCGDDASRSMAIFVSNDGEFSDEVTGELHQLLSLSHEVLSARRELGPKLIEALEGISLGMTYPEVCKMIGISRTALKFRLTRARDALGVESNIEAVRTAIHAGLIEGTPHVDTTRVDETIGVW